MFKSKHSLFVWKEIEREREIEPHEKKKIVLSTLLSREINDNEKNPLF